MTYHILIPDLIHPAAVVEFDDHDAFSVTAPGKMTREETLEAVKTADALIVRSGTQVDDELIAAAPKLKAVARAGVGVDNIDLAAASRRGIVVMNTPGGNTVATAEHTIGLMLALARHIPDAQQSMREGRWDRKRFVGFELRGKTLGLIGFGRIGQAVAQRARAFEMVVIAHDPYQPPAVGDALGVEPVSLEALYARADIISLHPIYSAETNGMINAESLKQMKAGVRIINAARGALIVDDDLAAAVKSGHVAGAAVDVYAQEPPSPEHPLVGLPGVVHTPHLAASTVDAQISVAVMAAQLIIGALQDQVYQNVVNTI